MIKNILEEKIPVYGKGDNVYRTLAIEYIRLRLVISSLVKYSLFCIIVFLKYNIQI